ncbi:hypothetical protein BDZ45DRAFT_724448 [Acephala macrosclerotiorum]|nr:hypothetical protein BDZ45DRAFT_724448 [Acephala macrosclerotiorum]
MYHRILTLALLLATSPIPQVHGFIPTWTGFSLPLHAQLYCARAYDRASSQIAYSQGPNQIWQITALCKNSQGGLVNQDECHHSVVTTGIAMALSVLYWEQATWWGGVNGPNRFRRSIDAATSTAKTDDFLSRIPDHIPISNVKFNNAPLPASRQKRNADEYNVFYNGSLPLTFIMHHPITSTAAGIKGRDTPETLPMFAATDGTKLYLTHIIPLNTSTASSFGIPTTPISSRSGYNGYNYIGTGGLKIQSNSDPVATWGDVMSWLDAPSEINGWSPFQIIMNFAFVSSWIGHSFMTFVHDKGTGKGYNGQFVIEGETTVCALFFTVMFWVRLKMAGGGLLGRGEEVG